MTLPLDIHFTPGDIFIIDCLLFFHITMPFAVFFITVTSFVKTTINKKWLNNLFIIVLFMELIALVFQAVFNSKDPDKLSKILQIILFLTALFLLSRIKNKNKIETLEDENKSKKWSSIIIILHLLLSFLIYFISFPSLGAFKYSFVPIIIETINYGFVPIFIINSILISIVLFNQIKSLSKWQFIILLIMALLSGFIIFPVYLSIMYNY